MKKIILLVPVFLLFSCNTLIVKNHMKDTEKPKNIVLFSTIIGKINEPALPILYAPKFNERTIAIASQLNDLEKQKIDNYRNTLASSLKNNFKCDVIFGNSLVSHKDFLALKQKYDNPKSLLTENEHFPNLITASNDINPFAFEKGNVIKYFYNPTNYKGVLSELSKTLNSDYIAISFSELRVMKIGYFAKNATVRLETYLYLFDQNGNLISEGLGWTDTSKVSGSDPKEYESILDNFEEAIEPLVQKLAVFKGK